MKQYEPVTELMCSNVKAELLKKFRAHFGREPDVVAYAPGRVEVLALIRGGGGN